MMVFYWLILIGITRKARLSSWMAVLLFVCEDWLKYVSKGSLFHFCHQFELCDQLSICCDILIGFLQFQIFLHTTEGQQDLVSVAVAKKGMEEKMMLFPVRKYIFGNAACLFPVILLCRLLCGRQFLNVLAA